jgi:aerobic carbon-monoxide dehydrogenase small subunit
MTMRIDLTVNGRHRTAVIDGCESLLHVLREHVGLAGTKNACTEGECGSCAVRLDGDVVNSCLVLAAQADGADVVTVEGLGDAGRLHPVQEALLDAGAVQCGFCTPGLVVAIADLLERERPASDAVVRESLAGHLCRCTGYQKILDAVRLAADRSDAEVPT